MALRIENLQNLLFVRVLLPFLSFERSCCWCWIGWPKRSGAAQTPFHYQVEVFVKVLAMTDGANQTTKRALDKDGESPPPPFTTSTKGAAKESVPPAAPTPSSSSTSSVRRVSFHSSTKHHDGINGDPLGISVPRRVTLGKGGKNAALRDAFFLLAFVGMLLYFAMNVQVGPTKDNKPRKKDRIAIAEEINKIQKSVANMMMESVENSRRKEGCDLFTAKGSIPDTGLGVFAGRRFVKGEVIYETTGLTVPVEVSEGKVKELSSLALLLKFHPLLGNVETVDGNLGSQMKLRATRAIKPGDELFLPYEQHPLHVLGLQNRTLFGHIPLASDYQVAKLLQNDIVVEARRMEVAHQRRVQDAIRLNVGYLYSLGAKITDRFSPNVAKLLPDSIANVKARKDLPLPLAALENQTLSKLQLRGSCYGDTKLNSLEDGTFSVIATRKVNKGEKLQIVPVHLVNSTATIFDRCVSSKNWHACLLTDAAMITVGTANEANVALQWKDDKAMKEFLKLGGTEARAGSASLELVAQSPIDIGEKVSDDCPKYASHCLDASLTQLFMPIAHSSGTQDI